MWPDFRALEASDVLRGRCPQGPRILFFLLLGATGLASLPAIGAPPDAVNSPAESVARIARVGQGYDNLRGEFPRLEARIVEIRMKIGQSEVLIVTASNSAAQINEQIAQLRAQAAPPPAPGQRGRPPTNNSRQIDSAITALNNQLLVLGARVREERGRLTALGVDLAKTLQQQDVLRRQAYKQVDEYWKTADPFGRYSEEVQRAAVAELSRQLHADRENAGALLVRGICHRRLGQAREAEDDLTAATAIAGPLQALAFAARGELYFAQEKEKEGKADIAKATTLSKKKPDARVALYRGWVLCGQGKYDLAEVELTKALRLGGVDADAHRLLALIGAFADGTAVRAVSVKEALEHGARACELTKSEDWLSLEALAASCFVAGEEDQALEQARKSAQLATGDNKERCDERVRFFEQGQRPQASWPDVFRLTPLPRDNR